MTHSLGTRIATVGLAGVLLIAGSTLGSYAANGGSLVLGHKNTATKTTTLRDKKGTALSLKSKAGTAPFKVSNDTVVTHLNADLVDGKDSTDLQTKSYVYSLSGSSTTPIIAWSLPGLPAGKYLVQYGVTASSTGTFFACALNPPTGAAFQAISFGSTGGGNSWFVSGGGYADLTSGTWVVVCQSSLSNVTVPVLAAEPADVTFTRVDSATTAVAPPTTLSRGALVRGH